MSDQEQLVTITERDEALAEVKRLRDALANLEDLRGRISTVLDLLASNGCDCECGCDNNHNSDCERCLACRVAAALAGLDETP